VGTAADGDWKFTLTASPDGGGAVGVTVHAKDALPVASPSLAVTVTA
jgi:hypothetical protein